MITIDKLNIVFSPKNMCLTAVIDIFATHKCFATPGLRNTDMDNRFKPVKTFVVLFTIFHKKIFFFPFWNEIFFQILFLTSEVPLCLWKCQILSNLDMLYHLGGISKLICTMSHTKCLAEILSCNAPF